MQELQLFALKHARAADLNEGRSFDHFVAGSQQDISSFCGVSALLAVNGDATLCV